MARMSSLDANTRGRLGLHERQALLDLARASVEKGLVGGALDLRLSDYPPALREPRASFVTLHVGAGLCGCIGSLEPHRPLALDVVENAWQAAFADPRFPRLTRTDLAQLEIHISILGPPEVLRFSSEQDLLKQLRAGVDGLILSEHHHRATFLPAVWETLPEPPRFICALKQKAGLSSDYWSDTIKIERYTAESVP